MLGTVKYYIVILWVFSVCACSTNWQQVTQQDLAEIKASIAQTHPAFIEKTDISTINWWQQGYQESLALIPQVKDIESASAVIQYYIQGFEEPHMSASTYPYCFGCFKLGKTVLRLSAPIDKRISWAGFMLDPKDDGLVVSYASQKWPVPLPDKGATLFSCDGEAASNIIKSISLFTDRRLNVPAAKLKAASSITFRQHGKFPLLNVAKFSACEFINKAGNIQRYSLIWQDKINPLDYPFLHELYNPDVVFGLKNMNSQKWLSLTTFNARPNITQKVDELLPVLQKLDDSEQLVIDLRGNRGGSMFLAYKILLSLFPDTRFNATESGNGFYRISETAKFWIELGLSQKNMMPEERVILMQVKEQIEEQKIKTGQALSLTSIDRVENMIKMANKRTENFSGNLILVTDLKCFSACLAFVDKLKLHKNVIHVGQSTDADTKYTDPKRLTTASTLIYSVPILQKERIRQDNQVIRPDIYFNGNINDNEALAAFVQTIE